MTAKELHQAEAKMLNTMFQVLGFEFEATNFYGHHHSNNTRWARTFIKNKEGCTLGRITYKIYNDSLSRYGIKSYKRSYHEYSSDNEIFFQLEYLFRTGEMIADYREVLQEAGKRQIADTAKKVAWRVENPIPKHSRKKRKALISKGITSFINDIISERVNAHTEYSSVQSLIAKNAF